MTDIRQYGVLALTVGMLVVLVAGGAEAKSERVTLKVQGLV